MSANKNSKNTSVISYEKFNMVKAGMILENWGHISEKYRIDEENKRDLEKYFNRGLNGIQKVHYNTPSVLQIGRKYALNKVGYQGLKRIFRHTIGHEYYIDVDMVNAHPVILSHLCRVNNIRCDKLDEYINNREQILKDTGLERGKAKERYLLLMNTEQVPETMELTDHMTEFSDEMNRLQTFFSEKNPNDFEKVKQHNLSKPDGSRNHKASYMNQLMCKVEDDILMSMYKYFGYPKDCALCFDGIMLKKGEYDLNGCIKQVKTDVGIDIKLEIKPMDNLIDLSIYKPYKIPYIKLDSFNDIEYFRNKERHLEHFEKWIKGCVSKVLVKGKAYYAVKYRKSVNIVKMKDFQETMGSMTCFILHPDPKPIPLKELKKLGDVPITVEGMDGNYKYVTMGYQKNGGIMRTLDNKLDLYMDLDYIPYLSTKKPTIEKDVFNTFEPYPFDDFDKTEKRTDTKIFTESKFYEHYKTNFFREEGEFEHFLDAIADMVQDPLNIKGNAHLFYSAQGTGKGILAKFMQRLLGDDNVNVIENSENYFTSRFNGDSANKILKIFEELKTRGAAQKNSDRVKAEITAESQRTERKRQDAYKTRNCARYWFFTNNESAISAEHDDRRFTMHKVACRNRDDKKYFKLIADEVKDDNFIKSALHFFAIRSYTEENIRTVYDTGYKMREKIDQLGQGIRFLIKFVEESYSLRRLLNNEKIIIRAKDFNQAYRDWCDDEGIQYKASTFKTQLKHLDIDSTKRHVFNDGRTYSVQFKLLDLQTTIQEYLKSKNWLFDIEGNENSLYEKKETKKPTKAKTKVKTAKIKTKKTD